MGDPITRDNTMKRESPEFSDLIIDQSPDEIRQRLDIAARRGRIPGLHPGTGDRLFHVDGCGTPFDHHLTATWTPADRGTRVSFTLERQRRVPLIFAAALAATVWPGVYFMDQLIPGEWNWIRTEYWYLPLTILPIPWFWRATARKSRQIAMEDAHSIVAKVRTELGLQPAEVTNTRV